MLNLGDFYLTHDQMVVRVFSVLNPENPVSYQLQVDGQNSLITLKADETDSLTPLRTMNPKDQAAQSKPGLTNVPLAPLYEVSAALVEGAIKYGPWNWRTLKVDVSVYIAAAMRHLSQYQAGEDVDKDSGISHVTKAIAGLIILRDAMIHDCANDDRGPDQDLNLAELQAAIQDLKAKYVGPEDQASPAALLLEVGKTYVNEWGEKSTITGERPLNPPYTFTDGESTFNRNGEFFEGYPHKCDLVAEFIPGPEPDPKPKFQLESGKTYRSRSGDEVTVREVRPGTYPFAGPAHSYTINGEVFQNYENHDDLYKEVPSSLKLEAGKTYISRDGVIVFVKDNDSVDYPFRGPSHTYTPEGLVYEQSDSSRDLVREV